MSRLGQIFGQRTVLCDGAMGTILYARGVSLNTCYDELNLSQPGLVRAVHEDYLESGAEIVETNTFGANAFRLRRFGIAEKVGEINAAGARIARQAVTQLTEKRAGSAWVAGAVGPLGVHLEPLGKASLAEARAAFAEQIRSLADAGVDLLSIETVTALNEAEQAILAARETAPALPVLVMVTVDEEAHCLDGTPAEAAAVRLAAAGVDAIGVNCSVGPATVLTAIERMRAVTTLPLAAMPNAGLPRALDGRNVDGGNVDGLNIDGPNANGRNIYLYSPEDMATFAREFVRAGVQFVGGCCGTTPGHIEAMASAVLRASPGEL